ncbi:hypothetical protein, partial [Turicimonas muris]|uniref:hypothetical protein n=1 Tax=Turicimonas muris TaxID=1796652 RepID=UPI00248D3A28
LSIDVSDVSGQDRENFFIFRHVVTSNSDIEFPNNISFSKVTDVFRIFFISNELKTFEQMKF